MARTLGEEGKECQAEGEAKVSHEKPQLDDARKLRGIYFIDLEDKEFKETIKNARKKLDTSVAPVLCFVRLWRTVRIVGMVVNPIRPNQKLACILEASESARLRMGESLPTHHEDHLTGKGDNSLQHYKMVHKFIPMPQAIRSKSSNGQGMGKIG